MPACLCGLETVALTERVYRRHACVVLRRWHWQSVCTAGMPVWSWDGDTGRACVPLACLCGLETVTLAERVYRRHACVVLRRWHWQSVCTAGMPVWSWDGDTDRPCVPLACLCGLETVTLAKRVYRWHACVVLRRWHWQSVCTAGMPVWSWDGDTDRPCVPLACLCGLETVTLAERVYRWHACVVLRRWHWQSVCTAGMPVWSWDGDTDRACVPLACLCGLETVTLAERVYRWHACVVLRRWHLQSSNYITLRFARTIGSGELQEQRGWREGRWMTRGRGIDAVQPNGKYSRRSDDVGRSCGADWGVDNQREQRRWNCKAVGKWEARNWYGAA